MISLASNDIDLLLEGSGYIRMEMETASDGLVLTNPVWFEN